MRLDISVTGAGDDRGRERVGRASSVVDQRSASHATAKQHKKTAGTRTALSDLTRHVIEA